MPNGDAYNLMLDPSVFMGEVGLETIEHIDRLIQDGVTVYIPETVVRRPDDFATGLFEQFFEAPLFLSERVVERLQSGAIQTFYAPPYYGDEGSLVREPCMGTLGMR